MQRSFAVCLLFHFLASCDRTICGRYAGVAQPRCREQDRKSSCYLKHVHCVQFSCSNFTGLDPDTQCRLASTECAQGLLPDQLCKHLTVKTCTISLCTQTL